MGPPISRAGSQRSAPQILLQLPSCSSRHLCLLPFCRCQPQPVCCPQCARARAGSRRQKTMQVACFSSKSSIRHPSSGLSCCRTQPFLPVTPAQQSRGCRKQARAARGGAQQREPLAQRAGGWAGWLAGCWGHTSRPRKQPAVEGWRRDAAAMSSGNGLGLGPASASPPRQSSAGFSRRPPGRRCDAAHLKSHPPRALQAQAHGKRNPGRRSGLGSAAEQPRRQLAQAEAGGPGKAGQPGRPASRGQTRVLTLCPFGAGAAAGAAAGTVLVLAVLVLLAAPLIVVGAVVVPASSCGAGWRY